LEKFEFPVFLELVVGVLKQKTAAGELGVTDNAQVGQVFVEIAQQFEMLDVEIHIVGPVFGHPVGRAGGIKLPSALEVVLDEEQDVPSWTGLAISYFLSNSCWVMEPYLDDHTGFPLGVAFVQHFGPCEEGCNQALLHQGVAVAAGKIGCVSGLGPVKDSENRCFVRRIWAHEISFFVPRPRDVAHPGSGPAQDLLRFAHPKNHFRKAAPQQAQLLQL